MHNQQDRELYLFPLGEKDWDPEFEWQGPLHAVNFKKSNHTLWQHALSVPHRPLPRVLGLPELKVLCKDICLSCSLFSCSKHPKRNTLKISNDGTYVDLNVSSHKFMASISDEAKMAMGDSLHEKEVYANRHIGPNQVRLRPVKLNPNLCLFCTRPLNCIDLHSDCLSLAVEPARKERKVELILTFKTEEDKERWRVLSRNRERRCGIVPGSASELVVRYISPAPQWLDSNICRCCGKPGSSSSFPSSVSSDRKTLTFASVTVYNLWKACHCVRNGFKFFKTGHGAIRLVLKSPMPWQGGPQRCSCCAQELPLETTPLTAPQKQIILAGNSAEVHFDNEDEANSWMRLHPAVRELPDAPVEWHWRFGIVQLLPLLQTLKDFKNFSFLEQSMFSFRHVVRSIQNCSALEASYVARQAHLIEAADLKMQGKHRIYLRISMRKSSRRRVFAPAEMASNCDELGRAPAGSIVGTRALIVCYQLGDRVEEIRVRSAGIFQITWKPHSKDFIDVAELLRQHPVEDKHNSALELHEAKTRKAKDTLHLQSQLVHLVKEATTGSASPLDSSLRVVKRLETGKGVFRAEEGTTRAQAETGAHVFHAGASVPLVTISETVASSLSVLRPYEHTREDHLALFNRRVYPGAWKVLRGSVQGNKRQLESIPDTLFHRSPCEPQMKYAQCLCSNDIIGNEAEMECTELLKNLSAVNPMNSEEVFSELLHRGVHAPLKKMQALAERKSAYSLARRIEKAILDPDFCWKEVILCRLSAWCKAERVTHIVAHPIDMDRYYVVRNPVDNSGSVQCVTLKVVPGLKCGSNFSALLLLRYGMDYDGDHAVFIAVLNLLSVQIQENLFGPENKLFSESGDLVIAPTFWSLTRWCSILEGSHVRLEETDALRILSGAGHTSTLIPSTSIRNSAYHRVGTRLRWAPNATYATVFAPLQGDTDIGSKLVALRFHSPWLLRTNDGRKIIVDAEDFLAVSEAHVAWKKDPTQNPVGTWATPIEQSEKPGTWLRILSRGSGVISYCSAGEVWRADISGADLLGCILASTLQPNAPIYLGPEKRMIWNGGQQVFGGGCCSFQVPACAARGWERLALKAILLERKDLHNWRRGLRKGWEIFALKLRILCRRGLRAWHRPLLSEYLQLYARRPFPRKCYTCPFFEWAALVLRMLYAQRSARAPTGKNLLDIVRWVAIHQSPHVALAVATNIQTTGYLICPSVQAQSHPHCPPMQQRAVELCTDLLNFSWDTQPPLQYPHYAEALAQLSQRALSEPCRRIFEKVVSGLVPARTCGCCVACIDKESAVGAATAKRNFMPSSSCAIKYLTDAGASVWASMVAHRRISARRACGMHMEQDAPSSLPSSVWKFFDEQASFIPPPCILYRDVSRAHIYYKRISRMRQTTYRLLQTT